MAKTKVSPKSAPKTPAAPALRPVVLSIRAEGAQEVIVTGDFSQWAMDRVRLEHSGDGEWKTTLELAPGEYQYRLLVDGQWRDHAEAPRRVPNPFGTENCVLTVG
jgi:1,4-alpha-glucan branching enzyme